MGEAGGEEALSRAATVATPWRPAGTPRNLKQMLASTCHIACGLEGELLCGPSTPLPRCEWSAWALFRALAVRTW